MAKRSHFASINFRVRISNIHPLKRIRALFERSIKIEKKELFKWIRNRAGFVKISRVSASPVEHFINLSLETIVYESFSLREHMTLMTAC